MTITAAPVHPASLAALRASADAHQQASLVLAARNPAAAERHRAAALLVRPRTS